MPVWNAENPSRLVRWWPHLVMLLAFGWWTPSAQAQYRFDHWTADNGLPQNSVRDLVQTRDGYLWMTTFDGLVRFDGVRFTVFNKSNTPGIPSNRFYALLEDRRGDLWATLESGEVVRRQGERVTSYHRGHGLPGLPNPALMEDDQGNVLVYFQGFTNGGKGIVTNLNQVYRWAGERFEPTTELRYDFFRQPISVEESKSVSWGKVLAGDFWIFTGSRILRYLKKGGVQTYHAGTGLPGKPLTLIWQRPAAVWAVTRDAAGGLWLTDLDSMHNRRLSRRAPDGFAPWIGYVDTEGNYWFSTFNNGLYRARRQTIVPVGTSPGLDVGEIYPVLEGRDGTLWIGSAGQGVFGLKNGDLTRYAPPKAKDYSSFLGTVSSLYEDRAGQVWVNGFWRLVDGRYVPPPWGDAVSFSSKIFSFTMCEDRTGAYWIGTSEGVARVQNGAVTHYTTRDGLACNDTKVIIEDGEGTLWLGGYGGLTRYKDGAFTAWNERNGLRGSTVRAIKADADGTLWVGTYDSGLARFKDGRFTWYGTGNGLFDNGVFQILEDDFGWFWMSCNRGIFRVRRQDLVDVAEGRSKTLTCLAYNQSDGMPSTECNGGRWPAGVRARDGMLWFPTMAGLAMVDPSQITTNTQPPPVVIEEMHVNNQPVPVETWEAVRRDPRSAVSIQPGQDNFEIAYTALSFINSENLRFKYMLEGADTDWVEAGTRRTAYFSHLAPGEYTFRVIAANAAGVWNDRGATLRVTIVPPFWRTGWFLALAVFGAVGLIAGAWQYRVARLRREQRAQQAFARRLIESQEMERKRIAAELHDSLGQNLLIVKNRAQLGQLAAHESPEVVEQFEWIVNSATQSIEEVRAIAQNLRPYHLDRLGLTKALEVMIEKVATTTGTRFTVELVPLDDLFDKDEAITLYRVVQESLNNVLKHAGASHVRVGVERTTDSVTVTVEDNGTGFVPSEIEVKRPGFGLTGMAERVRMLGGTLRIDATPGQGTTVTVRLAMPLEKTKDNA